MLLILLGLLTGIIGGMGIGGGTILIPSLIFLTNLKQQTIQSINLIAFIPLAVTALIVHYKNGNILFKISFPIIFSGLIGAWIGSKIALDVPSETLRKLFGIFLLVMGVYEIVYKGKKKEE